MTVLLTFSQVPNHPRDTFTHSIPLSVKPWSSIFTKAFKRASYGLLPPQLEQDFSLSSVWCSDLAFDTLRGSDHTIGFEDILDPAQSEMIRKPHLKVEYKLGLLGKMQE
uniref:Uncharacterized protein n=1 Tax=Oryzias melastigma TaxID=30732 RepID=A0A3B3BRE7_ORYME